MNLGWLENIFLQPPLYLLSPRGSCQARAWIHVALRTSLSSPYTWRSHGPIQDLLGAAENPPSSHLTKKRNLRKYLPCCLTHPSLIYYARSSPSTWRRRESPLHVWDSRAQPPYHFPAGALQPSSLQGQESQLREIIQPSAHTGGGFACAKWCKKNTKLFTFFFGELSARKAH